MSAKCRHKIVLAFTALLSLAALAASAPARAQAMTEAAADISSMAPVAATFTEARTLPGINQPLVLHGRLRFTPGQHLSWVIQQPYRYRLEISGDTITQVMPDGTRKARPLSKTPWAQALFKLFSGLFSGDKHALARYFDIVKKADTVVLTPRSEILAKWVTRITARGEPLPREVTIEQSDGSQTHLTLTPIGKTPAIAPAAATQ